VSTHSAPQTNKRSAGMTTMVLAVQAVVVLSLLMLTGSGLARRLHPVSTGTTALATARQDLSAAIPGADGRLLAAPEQHARAKARPPEPSGDAILPTVYRLAASAHAGQSTASPPNFFLALARSPFQPRAPPLSDL
jgi:outer membrane murein-binding lipoprotein Lpp